MVRSKGNQIAGRTMKLYMRMLLCISYFFGVSMTRDIVTSTYLEIPLKRNSKVTLFIKSIRSVSDQCEGTNVLLPLHITVTLVCMN